MSAKNVVEGIKNNDASMTNSLPSAEEIARCQDMTNGIHGAAKIRKGIKKATSAARRRNDKEIIKSEMND